MNRFSSRRPLLFRASSVSSSVPELPADLKDDLLLHLMANAGVTFDGSNRVSQWSDQSGNANHFTQSTDANKPIYTTGVLNSLPGLVFNGSSQFLTRSGMTQTESDFVMIFVVGKTDVSSTSRQSFLSSRSSIPSSAPSVDRLFIQDTLPALLKSDFDGSSYAATTLTYVAGNFYRLAAIMTAGDNLVFHINATDDSPGQFISSFGSSGTTTWDLGATYQSSKAGTTFVYLDGTICEILLYGTSAGTADPNDASAILDYLNSKWGV